MSAPTIVAAPRDSRDPAARIDTLLDPGTVRLVDDEPGIGVVTALGTVRGVATAVFATDPRVQGGALGSAGFPAPAPPHHRPRRSRPGGRRLWHPPGRRPA